MVDNITNSGLANQVYQNETRKPSAQERSLETRTRESRSPETPTTPRSDVVRLSDASQRLREAEEAATNEEATRQIEVEDRERQEKVQALKAQVSSGNYNVNAEQVAGKLVGTILEDLV